MAPTSESTTAAEWFARQNMSACFTCENEAFATSTLTFPGPRSTCGWYPHGTTGLFHRPKPSRYISQAENRLLFSRKRCFSHLLGPGARYRSIWAGARVTGLCLGYKTSLVGVAGQNRGRCRFFIFKNMWFANPPPGPPGEPHTFCFFSYTIHQIYIF